MTTNNRATLVVAHKLLLPPLRILLYRHRQFLCLLDARILLEKFRRQSLVEDDFTPNWVMELTTLLSGQVAMIGIRPTVTPNKEV